MTTKVIKFWKAAGLTKITGSQATLKRHAKELSTVKYGFPTDKVNWDRVVRAFAA